MTISTTLISSLSQGFARLTPYMHTGTVNDISGTASVLTNRMHVENHHIKHRTIF